MATFFLGIGIRAVRLRNVLHCGWLPLFVGVAYAERMPHLHLPGVMQHLCVVACRLSPVVVVLLSLWLLLLKLLLS